MCDPVTRLSYAFSQYYDLTARNAASCDSSSNATINPSVIDLGKWDCGRRCGAVRLGGNAVLGMMAAVGCALGGMVWMLV